MSHRLFEAMLCDNVLELWKVVLRFIESFMCHNFTVDLDRSIQTVLDFVLSLMIICKNSFVSLLGVSMCFE